MKYHLGLVALLAGLLSSCDSSRVYERNSDLVDNIWHKDSVVIFDFEIEDPTISYNIYYNIRNAASYPFYNLYLNHTIKNSLGSVLSTNLDEVFLFDRKTGQPLGSGMGDIFDHRMIILENFRFPSKGTYKFTTQQYMRQQELSQIMAVGIRIEISQFGASSDG